MIWTSGEERPRQFHGLGAVLAAGTRAQAASSAHTLRQALAAPNCVWGYRSHRMMKNAPGGEPGRTCGRCGYAPPADEEAPQEGAHHAAQRETPRAARGPRGRRIGLQPGRVVG